MGQQALPWCGSSRRLLSKASSPPGPLRLIRSGWRCLLRTSLVHAHTYTAVVSFRSGASRQLNSGYPPKDQLSIYAVADRDHSCTVGSLGADSVSHVLLRSGSRLCTSLYAVPLNRIGSFSTGILDLPQGPRVSVSLPVFKPDNLPTKVAASTISYSKNHEKL